MTRAKVLRFPVVITAHVFDKIRSIDMTLAEFQQQLGSGEVIEETVLAEGQLRELVLVVEWARPLHVVFIVVFILDPRRAEERVVTVYEPEGDQWARLSKEATLMRCEHCDNGERQPARRARLAEKDGRTAVVLDVPVEVCPACGEVWLALDVAVRLDALFNKLLSSGAESAQVHWDQAEAA